jgi:hypothetical protein
LAASTINLAWNLAALSNDLAPGYPLTPLVFDLFLYASRSFGLIPSFS